MAERIQLPNGAFFPLKEGENKEQALAVAKQMYPDAFAAPVTAEPKQGGSGLGDIARSFGLGALGATGALASTFGADNAAARGLAEAGESLQSGLSTKRKAELQAQAERMKQAEESGSTWQEIKAGLLNVLEAPVQSAAQAVGSFAPMVATLPLAKLGLGARAVMAVRGAIGGAQGAGAVKQNVYEAVLRAETEEGRPPEQAQAAASRAQAYVGDNLDQIMFGGGLGVLAGRTGAEKLLPGGARAQAGAAQQALAKRVGERAATGITAAASEMPLEGLQGGQERLAANLALQRTGRDVGTFTGVAGQAAQEALTGGLGGGALGAALPDRTMSMAAAEEKRAQQAARAAAAEEQRQLQAQQAAAEEAERNSAPYAMQVGQQYDTLLADFKERKAALKTPGKDATPVEKAEYADAQKALKELNTQLKELVPEYRRTAPIRQQAQEQARVAGMDPFDYMMEQTGEVSTRKIKPVADTAYEESGLAFQEPAVPEKPLTPEQKLQQYVAERTALVQDQLPAPEVKDYVDYLLQDPTMADQMVKTRTKMPDLTRQENEAVLGALKLQLKAREKAEQAQRAAESARLQAAGQQRIAGVEEEEQAALAQAEAERQAAAAEAQREAALGGERFSLQKMRAAQGAPQNVFDETAPYSLGPKLSDQFGLFGEEQAAPTPGIAPIGQMRQKLLGEDVTFTAEEEKQRNLRRVPGAEFKLRARAEGTGAPVTRDELADRINTVLSTYELSPEAAELLQRVEKALPQKLSPEYTQALDEQLALIERGQEGVPRKGAERPTTLQAFPAQGARAETAAPTEAYKYETKSLRSAQPGQAQTSGKRVAQPEGERVAADAGETPVQKRVSDITPKTLRGQSAAPAPLSALEADRRKERNPLVEMLRTAEAAAAEDAGQMALFPAEEKKRGTIKETSEDLRRVQDAPTARKVRKELREAEAAKKAETPAQKARAEQGAKDAELLQYKRDLSDARAKYINDVLEQQRVFAERAKDLPGDGGQARIRRVRALSEIERDAREAGLTADAAQGVQYKNALYNKDAGWLLREIGKVEKRLREITDQVKAAKKKSASYTGDAAMVKAFKGQASAIRAQSRLSVQLAALNNAYELRSGAAQPRVTDALRVKEKERARPEEREEVDAELERVQTFGVRKERLDTLKEQLAAAKKDGTEKSVRRLSEAVIKAEAELAEVAPKPLQGKVTQASRVQTSAPGKLRAGTEESKKATGATKRPVVEGRTEKLPTAKQVIEEGNLASLLKKASEKPKTVAELKALSIEQDRVVTEAQQKLVDDLRIQKNKLEEEVRALEALQAKGTTRVTAETLKTKKQQLQQVTGIFNRADKNLTKYYNTTVGSTNASDVEGTEMRGTPSRTMKLFDEDDGFSGSMYRVSDTKGKGTTPQRLEAIIKRMTADWKNVPTIVMAETYDALPDNIKAQAEADGVAGYIPGVYDSDNNTVYLVAENLPTDEDIYATVAHEIAGHYGLRSMLGADYTKTMDDIYNGNADVKAKADAKMERIPSLSQQTATEEVLADMAENAPAEPKGALRQLYDRIKRWFRETLRFDKMTDKAVQQIVENARKYVIEGTGGRAGQAPKTKATYRAKAGTSALDTLADKIIAEPKTFKQKLGSNLALEAEMQGVDMRAGLREVLKAGAKDMGDDKLFTQAMYNVLKSDQKMPLIYTVMSNGPLETYRDDKGLIGVRSTNKNSAKEVYDAVAALPGKDAAQKDRMATAYMVAQRASNKGLEKLDIGALGVKQADLDAVLAEAEANDELRAGLEAVRTAYNAYNKGMIDFLATTGAIPKAVAKKLNETGDYVPFYRVDDNGQAELVFSDDAMITIGDIRRQPYLAELKGGEQRILPLSEALPRNTILLTDKALTNMATKGVAYGLQSIGAAQDKMKIQRGKGPADPRTIRFNQEPDPNDPKDTGERWLRVDTDGTIGEGVPSELLVKSLEGAHLPLPGFLKLAGTATDILRSGVTRTPLYIARQLIREPMAAAFTGGLNYNAFTAVLKGGKKFVEMTRGNTDAEAKLLEKGLIQSGIFTGDVDDMKKFSLQLVKGDQNALEKLFAVADRQAIKADAATRSLVYENALANGMSEVEADFMTMESMNFYKRGLSPTVQYASRLIPFFNAQIQGLNVLYKAATGKMPFEEQQQIKRKFFNNAALMMATGIVYAMAMEDDEAWRNARPRDKMSNFFIPLPGTDELLKLPIPFEAGYFYSLAVAAVDGMREQTDNKEQWKAIKDLFLNSIPGASSMGVPQIVKPVFEVWTNKNFMSGSEVESRRLQGLSVEERYNANTTELAKQMSKALPLLSPIQIEHIVRGYLGVLPLAAAAAANGLFEREGKGERPEKRLSEMALVGSAFQKKFGGADSDVVYRLAGDAMEARTTLNRMLNEGRREEALAYREEHRTELQSAAAAGQYRQVVGRINADLRRTQERTDMTGEQKRARIDQLEEAKQQAAQRFIQLVRRIEGAGA